MNASRLAEDHGDDFTPVPVAAQHEDALLLARLQSGEDSAFEELVNENGGRMLATARRLVRGEEDAQDVVQESFLLAFRSLASFEGRSRLSTWLHRIVVNVALMKLRSRKRRPEVSIEEQLPRFDASGHRVIEAHDVIDLTPADELHRERMLRLMRQCMERLPESYRVVLMLRDIEDLSTEEAAEALGIKTVALKVRLHRARQALKTLLQKSLLECAVAGVH